MAMPDTSSGTLYIDGKWRPAASGRTFPVTNPATSEVLAKISAADTQDVREAIAAADAAFPAWAARTAYERANYLYDAHRLMVERIDDLARLMTTEQGKPLRTAGLDRNSSPTTLARSAVTRFTTPAGTPTSCRIRNTSIAHRGVCCAGLSTTVQPAASAGPIFLVSMEIG